MSNYIGPLYLKSMTVNSDSVILTNVTTFTGIPTPNTLSDPTSAVNKFYVDNSVTTVNQGTTDRLSIQQIQINQLQAEIKILKQLLTTTDQNVSDLFYYFFKDSPSNSLIVNPQIPGAVASSNPSQFNATDAVITEALKVNSTTSSVQTAYDETIAKETTL